VTSNPSIFEKAIGGTHDYDDQIRNLSRQGKSSDDIYQAVTIQDIQMATDVFRPVYNRTHVRRLRESGSFAASRPRYG